MKWNEPIDRRTTLKRLGAATLGVALGFPRLSALAEGAHGRVVVVGGGFGGATAAKYLKMLAPSLHVTLIEPQTRYITCPFSNLYLGGIRSFESLWHDYRELREVFGVRVVHEMALDVDAERRQVRLSGGTDVPWDRLILSPGVDIRWNALAGYDEAAASKAPHAWKPGEQSRLLREQLVAMPDGGTFVLVAPENPFRCPPGPYERVSMVAHYLKTHKPGSKILVLDAKDGFSKQALFTQGWNEHYGDMIEWVGRSNDGTVIRVDADTLTVETEFGTTHQADVLNVVPPQKAGMIADRAGVTDASGWVPIKPHNFESVQVKDVYVIGDATQASPMPKSGFMASTQAKVTARAIIADLTGRPMAAPSWANTCYSLIAPQHGISIAGVYEVHENQLREVPGSSGVSPLDVEPFFRELEAEYARAWYTAITQDVWGTTGAG
jgi:sulfide dehydrogenase [flavocytochrome c] flavoprotein chain